MARTWTQREKTLGVATLAALAAALLLRVAVVPLARRHRLLVDRERALDARCLRGRTNLLLKEKVEREREAYAREISRQGSDQEEQSFLLQEVVRLSRDLPVRIRGMRPLPPQEMGFYKRYAVSLQMEGNIEHVLKFLHTLESSPKLLKVERLHLSVRNKNRESLTAQILVS
ncbi:unnamed protein product, partial [marine sediment metagenome]